MDLSKLSVLVVEKSPIYQSEFNRCLRDDWWCTNITMLTDVPSAILRVRQRTTELLPFDLILCDHDLGSETSKKTGQYLLEELRVKEFMPRETTFIMLTSIARYEEIMAQTEIKPDGFYSKLNTKGGMRLDEKELEKTIRFSLSKRRIITLITCLMQDRKYQEARKICKAFLRREKKCADEIQMFLMIAEEKLEEIKKAEISIREGEFLFHEQKTGEAISLMKKTITSWPEHIKWYMVLSQIYEDTDEGMEAQKILEQGLDIAHSDTDYLRQLANVALLNNDTTVSSEQFTRIISINKYLPEDFVGLAKTMVLSWNIEWAVQGIQNLEQRFDSSPYVDFCIACIKMEITKNNYNETDFKEAYLQAKILFSIYGETMPLSENIRIAFMEECFIRHDDDMAEDVLKNLIRKTDRLIWLENKIKRLPASFQNNHKIKIFLTDVVKELHEESHLLVKENKLNEAVKQIMRAVLKFKDEEDILKKAIFILTAALRREWNEFYYQTVEKYYKKLEDLRSNDILLQTGAMNRMRKTYEHKIEALEKKSSKKWLEKIRDERQQERISVTEESDIVKARTDPEILKQCFNIPVVLHRPDDVKVRYTGFIRDISNGGFSLSCEHNQANTPDFETHDQLLVEFIFEGKEYKTLITITSTWDTHDGILRVGGYHTDTENKKKMMELNEKIKEIKGK